MTKELYIALQNQLKAKAPEVKHIDILENQLIDQEGSLPNRFPAVWIDFDLTYWKESNSSSLTGEMIIEFHVSARTMAEARENPQQDKALYIFDLLKKVYAALDGFSTTEVSPLVRWQTEKDKSISSAKVYIVRYKTTITDSNGVKEVDYVSDPVISLERGERPAIEAGTAFHVD